MNNAVIPDLKACKEIMVLFLAGKAFRGVLPTDLRIDSSIRRRPTGQAERSN
jgi:hypothetical protein